RRGIPHHQVDVLDVHQEASVAAYQRHGRADLGAIATAGRAAVVVGGSGLYSRALLDDITFPGTDPGRRAEWGQRAAEEGAGPLLADLASVDPAAAHRSEPRSARRVSRAWGVVQLTGEPFTASLPQLRYAIEATQIGLWRSRKALDAPID